LPAVTIRVRDGGNSVTSDLQVQVFLQPKYTSPELAWEKASGTPLQDADFVSINPRDKGPVALNGTYRVRTTTDAGAAVALIFKDVGRTDPYTVNYFNYNQIPADPENPPPVNAETTVSDASFENTKMEIACVSVGEDTYGHALLVSNSSTIKIEDEIKTEIKDGKPTTTTTQYIKYRFKDEQQKERFETVATCAGPMDIESGAEVKNRTMTIDCEKLPKELANKAGTVLRDIIQAIAYTNFYGTVSGNQVGEAIAFSLTLKEGDASGSGLSCYRQLALDVNNVPPTMATSTIPNVESRKKIPLIFAWVNATEAIKKGAIALVDDETMTEGLGNSISKESHYTITLSEPSEGQLWQVVPKDGGSEEVELQPSTEIPLKDFATGNIFYQANHTERDTKEEITATITEHAVVNGTTKDLRGTSARLTIQITPINDPLISKVPIVVGDPTLVFRLPSGTETPNWVTIKPIKLKSPDSYPDAVEPFIAPGLDVLRIESGELQINAAATNLPPVLKLQIELKKTVGSPVVSRWPMVIKLIQPEEPEPTPPPVPSAAQ
jgi:hypothetical protein